MSGDALSGVSMSIAPTTLLSLQQAGESLYAARQAFAQEVQHNASRVVGICASEPFSNDTDCAYGQLRTIARMAHTRASGDGRAAQNPVRVCHGTRSP